MDKRPKRRKSKDNPYTLISDRNSDIYKVKFIDNKGVVQEIDITPFIFETFNQFELDDLSQMNKDNLHKDNRIIDTSEESENIIYHHNIFYNSPSVEEIVEENVENEQLYKAISSLPIIQKNRIKKYFFEDKTLQEIADEEHCSPRAVKYSIDIGIKALKSKISK